VLTGNLLRVKRDAERIAPRYLDAAQRKRVAPVAAELVTTLHTLGGQSREEVERALDAVAGAPRDHQVVRGLRKLLLDRCEFETGAGLDPEVCRARVFALAAEARRALAPGEPFARALVLAQVGAEFAVEVDELERRLFADLRQREHLTSFRPFTAAELVARYDLALAQALLMRATRVVVVIEGESPLRMRQLFRSARFHGLLHRVIRQGDGYRIELDGPLSMFSAAHKYGLKLALFLPAVLSCARFRLAADVVWGHERQPLVFTLAPEDGLQTVGEVRSGLAPEIAKLALDFARLGSSWQVQVNDQIFALPGEAVCIPDLVFFNPDSGEQVYLEAFGFWSRKAVWQRIETLRRGFTARIILAVPKKLRVSAEVLEDDAPGELYLFTSSPRAAAILERLERRG
jgi:predicted nuclease of restriction endonuclease-like RecB superfamily